MYPWFRRQSLYFIIFFLDFVFERKYIADVILPELQYHYLPSGTEVGLFDWQQLCDVDPCTHPSLTDEIIHEIQISAYQCGLRFMIVSL